MTRGRWSSTVGFALALALVGCRGEPASTHEGQRGTSAPSKTTQNPSSVTQVPERVTTEPDAPTGAAAPTIERRDASDLEVFRQRSSRAGVPRDAARRDLQADEARGGHTIERHVAKSDEELRARLSRERQISAASSYTDLETAEETVGAVLASQSRRIEDWSKRRGSRPNLALDYKGDASVTIGRTIRRGARRAEPCVDAVVVLRWDERRGEYYVLTSYPEKRR